MKKAFTLAETLIVLVIIGVIASLTIPTLMKNVSYNNDKVLFKSAYKIVETAVSDLISDVAIYPAGQLDITLCNNFANKMNTLGNINCTSSDYGNKMPNFVTSNGMAWYGLDLADFNPVDYTIFGVDIDGINKGTNTLHSDIMAIRLYKTGKVTVTDPIEIGYLTN